MSQLFVILLYRYFILSSRFFQYWVAITASKILFTLETNTNSNMIMKKVTTILILKKINLAAFFFNHTSVRFIFILHKKKIEAECFYAFPVLVNRSELEKRTFSRQLGCLLSKNRI